MNPIVQRVENFAGWREIARGHLLRNTSPAAVIWQPADDGQTFLFRPKVDSDPAPDGAIRLPRAFVEQAKVVARHRDSNRWSLLYRIAWRIQNENRNLLHIEVDDDVRALALMRKAVENDIYKLRAFVRFRLVRDELGDQYVAWYRTEHHTLDANERFFVERFGGMRWAILTPEASMIWDLQQVRYGPGVARSEAPAEDEFEDLWRTYYKSVYNPARLNLDAMRAQLPVRRWEDLPESRAIPELVRASAGRVESMVQGQPGAASAYIPAQMELPVLREAVKHCKACELCSRASGPVFGEGADHAQIMLVGEQPGDEEDRQGRPFVGPAGQVLDRAMQEAGLERRSVYVTNAVKAFRFEERGKRRIHQTPRPGHIATCRPWLESEIIAVRPELIVCLGATAGQAVLGRAVRIGAERGRVTQHRSGAKIMVTYHPSAALRGPDDTAKTEITRALVEDLAAARSMLGEQAETPVPPATS